MDRRLFLIWATLYPLSSSAEKNDDENVRKLQQRVRMLFRAIQDDISLNRLWDVDPITNAWISPINLTNEWQLNMSQEDFIGAKTPNAVWISPESRRRIDYTRVLAESSDSVITFIFVYELVRHFLPDNVTSEQLQKQVNTLISRSSFLILKIGEMRWRVKDVVVDNWWDIVVQN